jgi:hypothetical protein
MGLLYFLIINVINPLNSSVLAGEYKLLSILINKAGFDEKFFFVNNQITATKKSIIFIAIYLLLLLLLLKID